MQEKTKVVYTFVRPDYLSFVYWCGVSAPRLMLLFFQGVSLLRPMQIFCGEFVSSGSGCPALAQPFRVYESSA